MVQLALAAGTARQARNVSHSNGVYRMAVTGRRALIMSGEERGRGAMAFPVGAELLPAWMAA